MRKKQLRCENCKQTLLLVEVTRKYYILVNDDTRDLTQERAASIRTNLELFCTSCGETYQCDTTLDGKKIIIGNLKERGTRSDEELKNIYVPKTFAYEKKFADYAGCSILEATMRYMAKPCRKDFFEASEEAAKSWLSSCRHALWVALEYFGIRTGEQDLEAYKELAEICGFDLDTMFCIINGTRIPANGQKKTLMAFFEVPRYVPECVLSWTR